MNLTRFDQDGLELFINEDGAAFASQRALARMCQKNEAVIRKWITAYQITVLSAEIQTETGLKTAYLLDEKAIRMALIRYNPELAEKCMEAGLRVFLYGVAGFQSNTPKKSLKALTEISYGELHSLEAAIIAEQEEEPNPNTQFRDSAYLSATIGAVNYAMSLKAYADVIEMIEAAKITNKFLSKKYQESIPALEKRLKKAETCLNDPEFIDFKEEYEEFAEKLSSLNALPEKSSRLLQG